MGSNKSPMSTSNVSVNMLNHEENGYKVVNIGMQFDRIGEIDTMNEKFYAELTIEAQWKVNKVIKVFDPDLEWNPRLYIENVINEPKEVIKYFIENDGNASLITQRRTVKGSFWERLELQNFPFDIQQLTVTVTTQLSVDEIKLVQNKKKIYYNSHVGKTFIDQQKWQLYKLIEITESASYDLESIHSCESMGVNLQLIDTPKISATCYVSRQPHYYMWNAFFLIFLITVCGLNTFSIDAKLPQARLQPSFTLLLTSISFKWVVNRSLPAIAYLTSLDKYAVVNIFYLCLIPCWHAIVGSFWEASFAKEIDKWLLVTFSAGFVVINLVFIAWFLRVHASVSRLKRKEVRYVRAIKESADEFLKISKAALSVKV